MSNKFVFCEINCKLNFIQQIIRTIGNRSIARMIVFATRNQFAEALTQIGVRLASTSVNIGTNSLTLLSGRDWVQRCIDGRAKCC